MIDNPVKIPQDESSLRFLYHTPVGRMILKLLYQESISRAAGRFMDSTLSCNIIPWFADKNDIDLSQYEDEYYDCFNAFFTRRIKPELRPIDMSSEHFIAPCDGLLSAYHIKEGLVVPIKQSRYRISDLVRSQRVADMYRDGVCLVFRLCVNHYHRYCYPDNGLKSANRHIDGILHTVRPAALRTVPVFTENTREYTLIKTENFGTIVMMEVGAMLVGKIHNHHQKKQVMRGEEKGYFEYGGSTVVLLVGKNKVDFYDKLFEATANHMETPVKMGEMIGCQK